MAAKTGRLCLKKELVFPLVIGEDAWSSAGAGDGEMMPGLDPSRWARTVGVMPLASRSGREALAEHTKDDGVVWLLQVERWNGGLICGATRAPTRVPVSRSSVHYSSDEPPPPTQVISRVIWYCPIAFCSDVILEVNDVERRPCVLFHWGGVWQRVWRGGVPDVSFFFFSFFPPSLSCPSHPP